MKEMTFGTFLRTFTLPVVSAEHAANGTMERALIRVTESDGEIESETCSAYASLRATSL